MKDEAMELYYEQLFPSNLICEWLAYGQASVLRHREFNFTLEVDGKEQYQRHISLGNSE